MRTADSDPAQGSRLVIANRYEVNVDQPLGRGGMAMVYPGRDLKTRRRVAVKTLRPEYQRDPESHHRFRSESRLLALVSSHPHIVSLYDFQNATNGSWMVMEYIDGPSLRDILDDEGPLDPETVMVVLAQMGQALSHIHAQGLVHLDVKPQNMLQAADGTLKLIDFGVAQRAGSPQEKIGGSAFGTAAYLAPEQASGRSVGPATDVYALGCVIYELLTGQPPFVAEGPDEKRHLIDAHLNARPQAPSTVRPELELPTWIDDVLGWALAKNPDARFYDVETFVRMFDAGLSGETPVHEPTRTQPIPEQGPTTNRRPRFMQRASRPGPRGATGAIDDVDDIPEVQPIVEGPARRIYRRGGRLARRSRRVRRLLWRIVAILLIANLLTGTIVMIKEGPSALTERFLSIAPGTSTTVVTETLNMRAGPGTDTPVVLVLAQDDEVKITGLSEKDDQGRWWPVEVRQGGETLEGWAWEGGLKSNAWTGRLSWVQGVADRVTSVKDSIGSGFDRVKGVIPGMRVIPSFVVMESPYFPVVS